MGVPSSIVKNGFSSTNHPFLGTSFHETTMCDDGIEFPGFPGEIRSESHQGSALAAPGVGQGLNGTGGERNCARNCVKGGFHERSQGC